VGKKKKSSGAHAGTRFRTNPLTGQVESIAGTKAGKKRTRLPLDHPLRTHRVVKESKKKA